ncbi:13340_t:CDS:2, partial [Funneliformis geosporum]
MTVAENVVLKAVFQEDEALSQIKIVKQKVLESITLTGSNEINKKIIEIKQ